MARDWPGPASHSYRYGRQKSVHFWHDLSLLPAGHPPAHCTVWKHQNAVPLVRLWKRCCPQSCRIKYTDGKAATQLGALGLIYYFATLDRKRSIFVHILSLKSVLESIRQHCWGNLVCVVEESRRQRNDE